jgi:hypothetical protein
MASTPNNPQQLNPYAGAGMLGTGEGAAATGGGFDPMSGAQAGVKYYDDQVAAAKKAAEEKAAADKKAADDAAAAAAAKKSSSRNTLAAYMGSYPGAYGYHQYGSNGGLSPAGHESVGGNSYTGSGSILRYGHG